MRTRWCVRQPAACGERNVSGAKKPHRQAKRSAAVLKVAQQEALELLVLLIVREVVRVGGPQAAGQAGATARRTQPQKRVHTCKVSARMHTRKRGGRGGAGGAPGRSAAAPRRKSSAHRRACASEAPWRRAAAEARVGSAKCRRGRRRHARVCMCLTKLGGGAVGRRRLLRLHVGGLADGVDNGDAVGGGEPLHRTG